MDSLIIRPLNPETEQDLFAQAYGWRDSKRKRHTQPDRMAFEDFIANDPTQLVMGLFNGELQAVYFFREWYPFHLESHFTTSRKAPRRNVVAGAKCLVQWLLENGAEEISAFVMPKNKPVCRFVEEVGFERHGLVIFTCTTDLNASTIPSKFVKYVCRKGN